MKKLIVLLISGIIVLNFVSCTKEPAGNNNITNLPQNTSGNQPSVEITEISALEVLEAIWNNYSEDDKFVSIGGDYNNIVENAPGSFSMSDKSALVAQLVCSENAASMVNEIASLAHAMNSNTFTGAVYKITDKSNVASFMDEMKDRIKNNRWICGSPEVYFVSKISDEYVVAAFGEINNINTFATNLKNEYQHVIVDIKST